MKLSQQAFADICGVDATWLGRVERGEKNLTFDNISKIAGGLKLKVSWLFDRADL